MKDRLEKIKLKLKQAADLKIKCFGSGLSDKRSSQFGHKWVSQPVPEDKIVEFETYYGITLPEEYRAFIKEVGLGAGPYYGLQKLGVGWVCDDETEEGQKNWLSSPCLLEPIENRKSTDWDEELIKKHNVSEDRVYQGIMEIISQGCTYLSGLIVTGSRRGEVVNLDMDMQVPRFTDLSFLDWYERWLDKILERRAEDFRAN